MIEWYKRWNQLFFHRLRDEKIIKGSDQMKIRWYGKKITAGLLLTVLMVPTFHKVQMSI